MSTQGYKTGDSLATLEPISKSLLVDNQSQVVSNGGESSSSRITQKGDSIQTISNSKPKDKHTLGNDHVGESSRSTWWQCFCCCGRRRPTHLLMSRTKSANDAILAWHTQHCSSIGDFLRLVALVTTHTEAVAEGLRPILAKFSIPEEKSGPSYSSVIGGYLWLITYGLQYLPMSKGQGDEGGKVTRTSQDSERDKLHPNPRLNTRLLETRNAYEEIVQIAQEWNDETFEFLWRIEDLRENAIELVTLVQNQLKTNRFQNSTKLKIDDKKIISVFKRQPVTATIQRRRSKAHQLSNSSDDRGAIKRDDRTVLKQSPVVILVQAKPNDRWEVFSKLEPIDKVELLAMFGQEPLRLISSGFKSWQRSILPVDTVEQPGTVRPSTIIELTCALVLFAKSTKFQKLGAKTQETAKLSEITRNFWTIVDNLYETTVKLWTDVNEMLEIVRTCYIYSHTFYNWTLKKFDTESKGQRSVAAQRLVAQEDRIKKFIAELKTAETVNLDEDKVYILADFMTTRYNLALQQRPVTSHGISLKLECWEDFKNEPWGLVDNAVDRRKSKQSSAKVKSHHFALSYRNSL